MMATFTVGGQPPMPSTELLFPRVSLPLHFSCDYLQVFLSKFVVASLCCNKSLNELMDLWFEPESQFDIPDTRFSLPVASFDLLTPQSVVFDEV